jgi:RNA polymerase sigma-70 factor (ECF subfamily)
VDEEATRGVSEFEERRLLDACRYGDPGALRQLVDAHYDPLYRFLWRLTASPEAAEELTQETFVRALERLRTFDGRARFSTWLHAIALNLWRDARRRAPRETAVPLHEALADAEAPSSEEQALAHLEQEEVRRAVERLPEAQRMAILLFYYQGMSYGEIAGICRCSTGTVGSWIHHGIRALRRVLGAVGSEGACGPERSGCRGRKMRGMEEAT